MGSMRRLAALLVFSAIIFANAVTASTAPIEVVSLDAVGDTQSVPSGRVSPLSFACTAGINQTSDGNGTGQTVVVTPVVLDHNDAAATLFTSHSLDCSAATSNELSNWDIGPQALPLSITQASTYFTLVWHFCYRPLSTNDDSITYQCVTNTNIVSQPAKLELTITSGGSPARGVYYGMAPFVFVFALILLCNVIIWRRMMARRIHQQYHTETRDPPTGMPGTVFGITAPRSVPTGLTPEAINGIPVKEVPENDNEMTKDLCVICQCEYQPKEKYKQLKCNHKFHCACIDAWLAKSAHCPICVTDLTIV